MKNTKLLLLVLLIIALVAGMLRFWSQLMLFLVSLVIAYILSPCVDFLCRKLSLKRGFGVLITATLALVLIVLFFSLSIPAAVSSITNLVGEVQRYAPTYDALIERAGELLAGFSLPEPVTDTLLGLVADSDKYITGFFTAIATSILNFSLGLFDVVVVVIVTVYFLLDGKTLFQSAADALPPRLRGHIVRMAHEANVLTKRYIRSRVLISFGMGVVTYVGLLVLGVRNAALFAVLAFLLDFIPYFGSIIAGALVTFYALLTLGLGKAIVVLIFVLVVQQLEGNVVAPKVQGHATGIHPVTVMFAILACGSLWGPFGMLIAVPVAAIVKIAVKAVYAYIIAPDAPPDAESAAPDS